MALEANKNGVQEAKRSKRRGRAQPSSPEVKRGRSRVVRRDGPNHNGSWSQLLRVSRLEF